MEEERNMEKSIIITFYFHLWHSQGNIASQNTAFSKKKAHISEGKKGKLFPCVALLPFFLSFLFLCFFSPSFSPSLSLSRTVNLFLSIIFFLYPFCCFSYCCSLSVQRASKQATQKKQKKRSKYLFRRRRKKKNKEKFNINW